MPEKRNILVIIADQLRADCIEGALAAHVDLPNIQAFRQEAVTFTNHFSVTNPCGPSRASIFTGRYAMNHRSVRNGVPLAHNMPNIARQLRKSGYDPMLFGYSDTAPDPNIHHANDPILTTEEGLLPGLREVVEMQAQASYPWRADLLAKGYDLPEYRDFYDQISPDPSRAAQLTDPPFYKAEDSDTAFLTNELLKTLAVKTQNHWAAFATYIRPHPPLVAPEPFNKMYDPEKLPLPNRQTLDAQRATHPYMAGAIGAPSIESIVRGFKGQLDNSNDADVNGLRALYFGLATELDQHFGRIIRFLKQSGQYDNTLVIFTADHGEMLGDHHLWGKQNPYDPSFRVPLVVRDPNNTGQHGQNISAMTQTVDLMPTVLDHIGQHCPAGVDGVSLMPFLEGKTPENWRDAVHLELDYGEPDKPTKWQLATGTDLDDSNLAILRESRFKLVHFNGGLPPLLFDLENDPHEMQNLAQAPQHQETLLRLTRKLLDHRMRHTDRSLTGISIGPNGAQGFNP